MHTVLFATLLAIVLVVLVRPKPAHAHTVTVVGEYQILAGWVLEPAVVGERNTMFIDFMRNNKPIQSAEARLTMTLKSGEQTRPVAVSGVTNPNTLRYTFSFIPTATGEMEVIISGLIGEDRIDVTVAPELISEADVIQFPNIALSNRDLQNAMIAIEERAAATQMRANVGIGVGAVGSLLGLAGVVTARRKSV